MKGPMLWSKADVGHLFTLQLRRPRAQPVTYDHARYLGPDPARDGVLCFWWEVQSVVLKVEEAVIESCTERAS